MNIPYILDGFSLSQEKNQQLLSKIVKLPTSLGLVTILVGNDPASHIYVNSKIKVAREVGIIPKPIFLPENITEAQLIECIQQCNRDNSVHGILVQLPLPKHINTHLILELISPTKDVDCFHPYNVGNLTSGVSTFAPATPYGIIMLLETLLPQWSIDSKNALVIGASNIVGKPTASLLLSKGATVTIAHKKTQNLKELCQQADLLVVAVGKPNLITKDMVKSNAVIIDVGINRIIQHGKSTIVGDVDFQYVKNKAYAITPVPKGVGPMTIHALMQNCIDLYLKYHCK